MNRNVSTFGARGVAPLSALLMLTILGASAAALELRVATFRVDVTPPVGSPLCDGLVPPVLGVDDPLSVTGAKLKSTLTGEIVHIPTDGIFIAIGHEPQSELFKGQLDMKSSGYILTAPHSTATNVPGVYAAGDVADDVYRQAVTAAGLGCMAALEAEKYLAGIEPVAQAAE